MKILHTSDWHIGRRFHGVSLAQAHQDFLEQLLQQVREHRPDVLIHSGDIYDKPMPGKDSLELFHKYLTAIADLTQIIMIPGNHDSAERVGAWRGLLREGITSFSDIAEVGRAVEVRGKKGELIGLVYPIPYLSGNDSRRILAAKEIDGEEIIDPGASLAEGNDRYLLDYHPEPLMRAAVRWIHRDLQERDPGDVPRVAVAHTFVSRGTVSQSETESISIGGIETVPAEVFGVPPEYPMERGLDYIALGHLHRYQEIVCKNAPTMYYAGSPLPYDFSEAEMEKGNALVEITPQGEVSVEFLPIKTLYTLHRLEDSLENIIHTPADKYLGDYVEVKLTDPGVDLPRDYYSQVRKAIPQAIKIHGKTLGERLLNRPSQSNRKPAATREEIINEFFTSVADWQLQGADRKLLQQMFAEAQRRKKKDEEKSSEEPAGEEKGNNED